MATATNNKKRKNDSTNQKVEEARPTIYSLSDYRVKVAPAVRNALQQQYKDHNRFDRLLHFMKMPPRQTVLRLTQFHDTRQARIQQVQSKVSEWMQEQGASVNNENLVVQVRPHPILDDVITIDVRQEQCNNNKETAVDATSTTTGTANPPLTHGTIENNFATRTIPDPNSAAVLDFPNATSRQQEGWPMTHRVVLVDRLAGEAMLRGADCFVRGILAADHGIRPGDMVAVYADLQGRGVARGIAPLDYNGECLFLGLARSHCARTQYFSQATGRALSLSVLERAGPILPPLDDWLRDGTLFAQNLPSLVVGHVLQAQPGDCIYDMCAAPGGKTSHVAFRAHGKATIVMSDKSRRKVLAAKKLFCQLKCDAYVVPLHLDGTASVRNQAPGIPRQSVQEMIASAKTDDDGLLQIDGFFPESFDRILLDPPCSALGLRPKLQVGQKTEKDLLAFASYQTRFIEPAVTLLKPTGRLVYSTCTFHARENEGMVQYILDKHPEMELVPITIPLGSPGLPGQGLSSEDCAKVKRFDPTVAEDTMGFFIACFVKRN